MSEVHEEPPLSKRNIAKHTHNLLISLSEKDPVTGLANFRALDNWLDADEERQAASIAVESDKRSTDAQYPLHGVVIFLDADGLGKANDISHAEGDKLLNDVVQAARNIAQRPFDFLARRGDRSDEFVAILPGDTQDNFESLAEKYKNSLKIGSASLAFGVYGNGKTARQTVDMLDKRLSEAKSLRPKGEHIEPIYIRE